MWPRHLEQLLGLWLAASPFVFGHASVPGGLWLHDLACAVLIMGLSMLTHLSALRRLHLALLPLAAALVLHGGWRVWSDGLPGLPATQNWIVVGLTLAMLAVIPSRASTPPATWQRFLGSRD